MNKKIPTPLAILIIFLVIVIIICVIILIYQEKEIEKVACTMEAKLCPDGSYVSRTGPNCEFTPCPQTNSLLSEAEARIIAEESCIKGGEALAGGIYNENSKTWWFDANLNAAKEGCNPACVVNEETRTAEVNWRCTGLLEP